MPGVHRLLPVVALVACGPELAVPAPTQTLMVQAAMAPAKCKPAAVSSPRSLVPDDAKILAEIDIAKLSNTAVFQRFTSAAGPMLGRPVEVMKKCGVSFTDVRTVTMGFDHTGTSMVVVQGPGIAASSKTSCFAREAGSGSPSGCPLRFEVGSKQVLVVDGDTLAFSDKAWTSKVTDRMRGRGKAALDHSLKWMRKEVNMSRTVWLGMDPKSSFFSAFGGIPLPKRVGLTVDSTAGLGFEVGAGFDNVASATAFADAMRKELPQAQRSMKSAGLSSVANTARVTRKAAAVVMSATASDADLRALLSGRPNRPPSDRRHAPSPAPSDRGPLL